MNHHKTIYFDDTLLKDKELLGIQGLYDLIMEELKRAMLSVRNIKAPGLNNVNAKLIRYGGFLLHLRILRFFKEV